MVRGSISGNIYFEGVKGVEKWGRSEKTQLGVLSSLRPFEKTVISNGVLIAASPIFR